MSDDTPTTSDLLREQVDGQLGSLVDALDHIDAMRDDAGHHDGSADCRLCDDLGIDPEDPEGSLLDWILEIVHQWEGETRDSAEWAESRIVLGTGGPHIEIVVSMSSTRIVGYWSSATVDLPVPENVEGWADGIIDIGGVR